MRTLVLGISGTALLLSLSVSGAWADGPLLPGKTGNYGRQYDTATEETFTATVKRVHEISSSRSSSGYIAAEVSRDDDGRVDLVYLGPSSKWNKSGLELQEGRHLCLTGSRVEIEGQPLVIARHVNDDAHWVRLRSDEGQHVLTQSVRLPEDTEFVCAVAALSGRP